VQFPFLPVSAPQGASFLMPLMPLALRFKAGETVRTHGLIDSGATVSVMPHGLGIRLGAVWEAQTTVVKLTGNLAAYEARALLTEASVGEFAPVRLVFAWTRADTVPLLLGQVNFFEEFNVSLRRAQRVFEIERATK
jgi:hypothetical protein